MVPMVFVRLDWTSSVLLVSPENATDMFPIKREIEGSIMPAVIAETVPPVSSTLSKPDRF
jgi:hypothetical protein